MALVQRAIEKTSFGDFLKSDPMPLILHSYNLKTVVCMVCIYWAVRNDEFNIGGMG